MISFKVTKQGKIIEVEPMNPEQVYPILLEEALRVIKAYPYKWTPGTEYGEIADKRISMPIRFKLT